MKRRRAMTASLAVLPLLLPAAVAGQRPQDTPEPPPYYAITGARIIPAAGQAIESGAVVIGNGLIQAVGTDVAIPPEAWVVDGAGLTVYPGLIDALSELGLSSDDRGGQPGGGPGPSTPPGGQEEEGERVEGPEDRPATTPWKSAADELSADDGRLERWREGGFTAAVSAPGEGIVAGQAAVIALAGEPEEMVVRTPVALRLNLRSPGGWGDYPGSLFGVLSYIEQLFLDADRYARAMTAYQADPRGTERPRYDRTLEPIQRAVEERWAVLIPADEAREIRRAVELGNEIGARTVIYGGQAAYEVADELAGQDVAVLVNVDWPEKTRDADPDADESLSSLEHRAKAPTTPAALSEAGVPFALYSGGLGTPRQVLDKAREAIEAGLPADEALRALTASPAEIFGIADRMGTIEAGKIANLVVTEGDLFEEGTKVRMVFVDGRKFEEREKERPSEPPAVDLTGTWEATFESRQGTQEATFELEMEEDGTLTGSTRSERGEGTITDGWVSGNRFSFTLLSSRGGRSLESRYTGTVEGDRLEGTASFGGRFQIEFSAEKRPGEGSQEEDR